MISIRHAFYLAYRYQRHNPWRSLLMVLGVSVALFLPTFTWSASNWFESELMSRARSSPVLIGFKGNEFDLVMASTYFQGAVGDMIPFDSVERIAVRGYGEAIPLHVGHSAQRFAIVGTSLAYAKRRGQTLADGRSFAILGEVVLGADVADELGLKVGDTVQSDLTNLYNLSGSYPFVLDIVGVYKRIGTPDDKAVFADVKTTWLLDGHFHGHAEVRSEDALVAPDAEAGNLEASAAVFMLNRLDAKSRASFHQHGEQGDLPISSVLVFPESQRTHDQLLGDFAVDDSLQAVEPTRVVQEVFAIVLRLEQMLGVAFGMVAASTAAFVCLVVAMSLRLREAEIRLFRRMGCSRGTLLVLVAADLTMILGASVLTAGLATLTANGWLKWYLGLV